MNDEHTTMNVSKIGIMGGTFDPIHYGHLIAAQEAYHEFQLDKVIFMPTGTPPHKTRVDILDSRQRYVMTLMAIADNEAFEISDMEVKRKTPSYTVETLRKLKKIYPASDLYFITGADAVIEILTWKEPQELASLTNFVAASRPGFSLKRFRELIKKIKPAPKVFGLEIPALAISSSDIRQRVSQGKPIRYLLPNKVWRYIYSKGFYK